MAIPDRSIDPRLLASAKAEFMKHGYLKAELKTICENAENDHYAGKAKIIRGQDAIDLLGITKQIRIPNNSGIIKERNV